MATDSISLNALHPEHRRFIDLKARVEAIGYRLYVTAEGTQLVIDHYPDSDRTPELVFIHDDGDDDQLEEWLADREQVSERVRRGGAVAIADKVETDDEGAPAERPEPVTEQLARSAADLGYMLFNDDSGGITVEKIGDPEAEGLLGGNLKETENWLETRKTRAAKGVPIGTSSALSQHADNVYVLYSEADLNAAVAGIDGIARALDNLDLGQHGNGLVCALLVLTDQVRAGTYATPPTVSKAVERALGADVE